MKRWDGTESVEREDGLFTGDMLADLRTQKNRLSVWQIDSDQDIDDAIVALALSRDKVKKLCYLLLDDKELADLEINIKKDIPVEVKAVNDPLVLSKHGDLVNIDYWRLGYLTEYMLKLAGEKTRRGMRSEKEVKQLLNSYDNNNKISLSEMKKDFLDSLSKIK